METLGDFLQRERLPNSLSAMIDLRLSRLPAHVLCALQAASIFNGPFVIGSVADLLQEQADSVEDAFNVALHERLLGRLSGVETSRYEFVHDLYAKRLYERLPANERRQLHARAAEGTRRGR
jgi:predicted ATPase